MRSPALRPQARLSAAAWARWRDARSTRATAAADRKPVLHPVRRDIRFRRTFLCPVRRPLWSVIFVEEFGQPFHHGAAKLLGVHDRHRIAIIAGDVMTDADRDQFHRRARSEEHTSELQSLMRISYAVFCLKKKKTKKHKQSTHI